MLKNFKILLLMFVCILAVMLSGCAEFRTMTVTNSDGSIDQLIYVSLDRQKIEQSEYTMIEIKAEVQQTAKTELSKIILNMKNKAQNDIMLTTDLETIEILQNYISSLVIVGDKWEQDTYVIGLRYGDQDSYKYFNNITTQSSKPVIEKHFFYNKVIMQGYSMYASKGQAINELQTTMNIKYPNLINSENQYLYTYTSELRRLHSNADFITKHDNLYYHTWKITSTDQVITLYYNVANSYNFIFVGIGISVGISVVLSIITIFINKRKRNLTQNN